MSQLFDKLNLRPQEKRLVVIGCTVLFVVLNYWFIWPHAGDLGRVRTRLEQGRSELKTIRSELGRTNQYVARLRELEGEATGVLPEDQSTVLFSKVQSQATKSGVNCGQFRPQKVSPRAEPAAFFEEQLLIVGVNPTNPSELIDFLLALASGDLNIRVKELDLKPDPTQTKLTGDMRLVASFQKKTAEPSVVTRPPGADR